MLRRIVHGWILILMPPLLLSHAFGLSTGFTYQGQLEQNGVAQNGDCDFQFSLFDQLTNGVQQGSTQTLNAVPVSNGLFTVVLNGGNQFGANAFKGNDRWLEIAARCPSGSGAFNTLSPRQQITATPYGMYAPNAGVAGDVQCVGCVASADLASAAIGTSQLSATGSSNGQVLTSNGSSVSWQNPSALTLPFSQTVSVSSPAFSITNNGLGHTAILGSANTGIGVDASSTTNYAVRAISPAVALSASNPNGPSALLGTASYAGQFTGGVYIAGGVTVTNDLAANALIATNTVSARKVSVNNPIGGGTGPYLEVFSSSNASHIAHFNGDVGGATGSLGVQISVPSGSLALDANGIIKGSGFNGSCSFAVNCNQDVAETFLTDAPTEPGDVVVLDVAAVAGPAVRRSSSPYERLLIGVVSTSPGLVFDQGQTYLAGDNRQLTTDSKSVVAIVGRVPTRVCAENGPIAIGDALTSSSTAGVAMRADAPGKIIGYALEASAGDGKILAWLQPGYFLSDDVLDDLRRIGKHAP